MQYKLNKIYLGFFFGGHINWQGEMGLPLMPNSIAVPIHSCVLAWWPVYISTHRL